MKDMQLHLAITLSEFASVYYIYFNFWYTAAGKLNAFMYCSCKTNFSVFKHQRSSATDSVFSRKALTHIRILLHKSLMR